MTITEGINASTNYPPKTVRFIVQTAWGAPISGATVTAQGFETTVGNWGWLYQLFGVNATATPIANTQLNGTTDDIGGIDFVMFEPVQYNMTFYKPGVINRQLQIYPKDDYYLIYPDDMGTSAWYSGGADINSVISVTVNTTVIDNTNAHVNVYYIDTSGNTTGGIVYLNQTNPNHSGAEVMLDSVALAGNLTYSFDVTNYVGESYFVRVRPVHASFESEKTYRDFGVNFPGDLFNPMGLTDLELMLLAFGIVAGVGCIFTSASVSEGPLITVFVTWCLFFLGWFRYLDLVTIVAMLIFATVVAIAVDFAARKKQRVYD